MCRLISCGASGRIGACGKTGPRLVRRGRGLRGCGDGGEAGVSWCVLD